MSTFLCKNGVRKEYFLTPTFIIEPFFIDINDEDESGFIAQRTIGAQIASIFCMRGLHWLFDRKIYGNNGA